MVANELGRGKVCYNSTSGVFRIPAPLLKLLAVGAA